MRVFRIRIRKILDLPDTVPLLFVRTAIWIRILLSTSKKYKKTLNTVKVVKNKQKKLIFRWHLENH